jgi:preprotein translocase subunit SecD
VDERARQDYVLFIDLAPADRHRFAALSRKLVGLPAPRDQIAIVVGGHVIAHPAVTGVATSGIIQISGITSRAQAVALRRDLRAG